MSESRLAELEATISDALPYPQALEGPPLRQCECHKCTVAFDGRAALAELVEIARRQEEAIVMALDDGYLCDDCKEFLRAALPPEQEPA